MESEESKSMNEPGIFWWKPLTLDNSENGAIARSYHTANFIDEDTGSKHGIHHIHVNKLYIFGGFDSNGAISSFQSVALEADTSGVEILLQDLKMLMLMVKDLVVGSGIHVRT